MYKQQVVHIMACCCLRVRTPECRCGGHVAYSGSLYETIVSNADCPCLQIFLGGPTSYYCANVTKADKHQTLQYCVKHNKTFYVHAPLIANLAKDEATKSLQIVEKELKIVDELPAAVVLHIGKVGTIANVCDNINQLMTTGSLTRSSFDKVPFHLLLEVAAGQGTEIGRNWEEIRHIYEGLDKTMVGICVDTQHAFASGMNKFETHENVVELFTTAQSIVPKGISMIHLNDSTKPFGSRVDRHAVLKQGHIWYHEDDGLRSLVELCTDLSIDMISETPDPEADALIVKTYSNQQS